MPIINTVEGDLIKLALEGRYDGICHGCNIYCTMGSGIAPQVAEAFPIARKRDNLTRYGDVGKLGTFSGGRHKLSSGKLIHIYNLYTQAEFGKPVNGLHNVDYQAIAGCFTKLNGRLKDRKGFLLGIPQIGAARAGGHWQAIETIINLTTPDLDIELVLYDGDDGRYTRRG